MPSGFFARSARTSRVMRRNSAPSRKCPKAARHQTWDLCSREVVGLGGLEPPTSPLSGARSSHLSYRPSQTEEEKSYNLFSLRCLSVIRNCVQTRILCTRQQFLYHFSLLSVLKMRVVAGDSQ